MGPRRVVDQTCQVKPECAADMYQIDVEMRRDVNASNKSFDLPETADFFRCWCSRAGRAPCGLGAVPLGACIGLSFLPRIRCRRHCRFVKRNSTARKSR